MMKSVHLYLVDISETHPIIWVNNLFPVIHILSQQILVNSSTQADLTTEFLPTSHDSKRSLSLQNFSPIHAIYSKILPFLGMSSSLVGRKSSLVNGFSRKLPNPLITFIWSSAAQVRSISRQKSIEDLFEPPIPLNGYSSSGEMVDAAARTKQIARPFGQIVPPNFSIELPPQSPTSSAKSGSPTVLV
jgi:hypothetical protein